MPDHQPDLPWNGGPVAVTDFADWVFEWRGNAYSATGPCPRCGAARQSGLSYRMGNASPLGEDANVIASPEQLTADDDELDLDMEVRVECNCGSTHKEETTGCGAEWTVRIGDLP